MKLCTYVQTYYAYMQHVCVYVHYVYLNGHLASLTSEPGYYMPGELL